MRKSRSKELLAHLGIGNVLFLPPERPGLLRLSSLELASDASCTHALAACCHSPAVWWAPEAWPDDCWALAAWEVRTSCPGPHQPWPLGCQSLIGRSQELGTVTVIGFWACLEERNAPLIIIGKFYDSVLHDSLSPGSRAEAGKWAGFCGNHWAQSLMAGSRDGTSDMRGKACLQFPLANEVPVTLSERLVLDLTKGGDIFPWPCFLWLAHFFFSHQTSSPCLPWSFLSLSQGILLLLTTATQVWLLCPDCGCPLCLEHSPYSLHCPNPPFPLGAWLPLICQSRPWPFPPPRFSTLNFTFCFFLSPSIIFNYYFANRHRVYYIFLWLTFFFY